MKIKENMVKTKTLSFTSMWGTGENKNAYITLAEWINGEGYDVSLSHCGNEKNFSLTYEEFHAIITLFHAFNLDITS